jgi:hypothetical protein
MSMVFLSSSCRETAKNAKETNRKEKNGRKQVCFPHFCVKTFLLGIFELAVLNIPPKKSALNICIHRPTGRRKKKKRRAYLPTYLPFSFIRPGACDMDFPKKDFNGVLNSPC